MNFSAKHRLHLLDLLLWAVAEVRIVSWGGLVSVQKLLVVLLNDYFSCCPYINS